jgi:large subunit ribosomal protein L17
MLRSLTTSLLENGKIVTTETRAKEVQSIVERLIGKAIREIDNFETKQVKVSKVPVDSKGKKMTVVVTSKNGKKYTKYADREVTTELVRVDKPSRLAARKLAAEWIYKTKNADGENLNVLNKLFDEIAVQYKDKKGGYTRIYKTGARRGDAAPMAILELA